MRLGLATLLAWAPVEIQQPHDEPPSLALAWSASEACPTREGLLDRLRAQGVGAALGEWIPAAHDQAGLAVTIAIEPEREGWRAELELVDADGRAQRSFSADDCDALADAVALIVAVTLDPVAVTLAHEARRSEPSREPASDEPAPVEPAPVEPASAEDRPLLGPLAEPGEPSIGIDVNDEDDRFDWPADVRVGLSLAGGGSYGPTRTGYGSLGGRLALFGRAWRVELGGRWATPRRIAIAGAAGSFDAWMVEARGCWVARPGPIELPLCPGIELGLVRGRGRSPTPDPSSSRFFWIAPTLGLGLTWAPIERLAIGPELALVVPLTRGRFVAGTAEIDRLAAVGVRALLNLELRLP
ncbi:hypothetical protein ACNOYE_33285 [Nannocystaceae bacterium ST9]